MRKLNKQDFIFAWSVLLFIVVTFMSYSFIKQYFIIDNCPILDILWGLPWSSLPHMCFWYLKFFERSSIYFYILFLWITIIPFAKRRYQFSKNTIFITWMVIIILFILNIYGRTSIIDFKNLPEWQQQQFFHN